MEAYVRDRQLGQGAMGTVHLVRRKSDGVKLALKTVAIASARDRQAALNEIAILRSLAHSHIVHFEDSFIHGEGLCIAMELCSGGDLAALIGRQREAADQATAADRSRSSTVKETQQETTLTQPRGEAR